jgi:hypothetical protein
MFPFKQETIPLGKRGGVKLKTYILVGMADQPADVFARRSLGTYIPQNEKKWDIYVPYPYRRSPGGIQTDVKFKCEFLGLFAVRIPVRHCGVP